MDYRAALIEFYQKHNPSKIPEVDLLLQKYKGREEELLHALKVKYRVSEQAAASTTRIQQTPPPPPPPTAQTQNVKPEPPPVSQAQSAKSEPPLSTRTERIKTESEENEEESSGLAGNRGRTAAERAEYWRKEVEKRERAKTGEEKFKVIRGKEEPKPKSEYRKTQPPAGNRPSKSNSNTLLIILVIAVLGLFMGVAGFVVLNKGIRNAIGEKLGILKKEGKKSGIDPDILDMAEDTGQQQTPPKSEGDFSLDDEDEGNTGNVQSEPNTQANNTTTEGGVQTVKESDEDSSDSPSGGPQRGKYYISYLSFSEEAMAKQSAQELKNAYPNSGYYFIPDFDPSGNNMYKVYIGPFSSIEEADDMIDEVRKLSPGAYPFRLK